MELKTNNSQRTNKDDTVIHNMDLRDSVNTANDPNQMNMKQYVSRVPHTNTFSFDNRGQPK